MQDVSGLATKRHKKHKINQSTILCFCAFLWLHSYAGTARSWVASAASPMIFTTAAGSETNGT
jgi:hypothetical protein